MTKTTIHLTPPEHDWFHNFIGKLCEVDFDVDAFLTDICFLLRVAKLMSLVANKILVKDKFTESVKLSTSKLYLVFYSYK